MYFFVILGYLKITCAVACVCGEATPAAERQEGQAKPKAEYGLFLVHYKNVVFNNTNQAPGHLHYYVLQVKDGNNLIATKILHDSFAINSIL